MTGYDRILVEVDPVLRDLVPTYLAHRREDIGVIKAALERDDFGTISKIGHNMHGSGSSFGFDGLSAIGTDLERAAKAGERVESARLVCLLEDYLSRIVLTTPEREAPGPEAGADACASAVEILVVDDQELSATIIMRYLSKEGYRVKYLQSGDDALAALAAGLRPALVLLDVAMEGTNGFDACRRIKANPATCNIPVVLVTSFDSRREFIQGWAAGADDVLAKPVRRDELVMRARSLAGPRVPAWLPEDAAAPESR